MKIGVIDVGTNAAKLKIYEVKGEEISTLYQSRIPLRLGDDVFDNEYISGRKKKQFIHTIQAFYSTCLAFEVDKTRAVATSAMRIAKNANEIVDEIKSNTQLVLEVITGNEEANLIQEGFGLLQFDKNKPYLIIDVGGGSTEISIFENGEKIAAKSFELGAIRLLRNKESKTIWQELEAWLKDSIGSLTDILVFGTGGNINKVEKILSTSNNDTISLPKIKELHQSMLPLSFRERMKRFDLKADRADVIVPAMEIFIFILEKLQVNSISIPKIGLSDGIIVDSIKQNKN
ncbi:MAG: exopolyphosphatase [Bacteroidetes bacterium]|nr:exopolyphosphatase [Bacteroidota bacterium]